MANDLASIRYDSSSSVGELRKLVSVVAPFFNEETGVRRFKDALSPVMDSLFAFDWQVVCVDDGSTDATLRLLIELSQEDKRYTIIELSRNFGKEAALTAGLDAAGGDAIIPMDADLQDPPELLEKMLELWCAGSEIVLARRIDRSSDSLMKRSTARLFYRLHNMMCQTKIPENIGDFRLMDRVVVDALKTMPERQRFMKGLFAWVGFRTQTINYVRSPRKTGNTKFSGLKLWNFALEGFTSFSTAPLKIWTYLGGFSALLTLMYSLFIIVRVLISGIDVPGYASTLVAVLFFGSVQMLSVGLLGEYIGRIYIETKQRPQYLIRKIYGHPK